MIELRHRDKTHIPICSIFHVQDICFLGKPPETIPGKKWCGIQAHIIKCYLTQFVRHCIPVHMAAQIRGPISVIQTKGTVNFINPQAADAPSGGLTKRIHANSLKITLLLV
ncbi:hypothetical protein PAE9249_01151 [Paenibacillus sp. CECT 9249]|nr:hypothetical protein PAE9249_01151 [Paenibacillus sp. CECT 9249]